MTNEIRIEVGRTWVWSEEISRMQVGSTVELEAVDGSDVMLYFNGKLVAKGQPVLVRGKIGVQVTEVVDAENHSELLAVS